MASVFDVAAYILQQQGLMTTWKLQKLVYYSQAWSLVWDDDALFPEEIEAWANGPVVRELYDSYRGEFRVSRSQNGNADALTDDQHETVDAVLGFYGDKSPQWLSDLTHMEDPWQMGLAQRRRSILVERNPAQAAELRIHDLGRHQDGGRRQVERQQPPRRAR